MSANTIDPAALHREAIAHHNAELAKHETEKAMQERDRIRKQTLITMEKSVKDQETRVESMKKGVGIAIETLQNAVKERFISHRGRYTAGEASVHVNAATQNLVLQMNGVHEYELSLANSRSQLEDAQRFEASLTKKD